MRGEMQMDYAAPLDYAAALENDYIDQSDIVHEIRGELHRQKHAASILADSMAYVSHYIDTILNLDDVKERDLRIIKIECERALDHWGKLMRVDYAYKSRERAPTPIETNENPTHMGRRKNGVDYSIGL